MVGLVVGSFDELAILESGAGAASVTRRGAPTVARLELAGRGLARRSLPGPLSLDSLGQVLSLRCPSLGDLFQDQSKGVWSSTASLQCFQEETPLVPSYVFGDEATLSLSAGTAILRIALILLRGIVERGD